jgi:NADPH2:quinone reductase
MFAAAGKVVSTGPGVPASWLGRRVLAGAGTRGSYAELVRTSIERLVPVPDGLDLPAAAALAHDGVTASGILDGLEVKPGDRVLILGAAGGMGTLLVQLVHRLGAHVVGAARGPVKVTLVRQLGAEAVDYTGDSWTDAVRDALGGLPVDVLLDGVGGALGREAFHLVADGGRVSSHGAASGDFATTDQQGARARSIALRGIADVQFEAADMVRLASRALTEAAAERLRPVIAREYPLSSAAEAHSAMEARSIPGKALLIP